MILQLLIEWKADKDNLFEMDMLISSHLAWLFTKRENEGGFGRDACISAGDDGVLYITIGSTIAREKRCLKASR